MWRSLFLAFGITTIILGAECLVVERAVLAQPEPILTTNNPQARQPVLQQTARRDFIPPEWAPWSLLSVGAVVILYSFTIPKRVSD